MDANTPGGKASHESERERALVDAARIEAAQTPSVPTSAPPPQSVRGRLGGSPFTLPPADTFPGYELLRELHRGGQGVVYQAIQKATRRKVAIKVMREGPFASQREHARFEREAQILGQLNHPGIVSIHDSGTTHQGLSYFVMDYISGSPLDVYMSGIKPGAGSNIDDALRMLVQICEAVSAAHLKGIIHRDLKPGNIIVDGEGHPHILDFGLAKVAGGETTGGGDGQALQLMTITGQFLGSMPWASPEQAEGRSELVDVRTDVYSLGVILYQVLTGRFPYEVVGNMREVLENIRTAQPAPPRKLRKAIREDVERIVLKCLQKDRDRRYQSAAELVRDIHHYLSGEPIEARRDSLTYVVHMHLRRHKLAVAIIVPFIIAAAAGSVTSVVLWRQAVRENAEAAALNHYLNRIIQSANPKNAGDKTLTVVQMLDNAAEQLKRDELETQPPLKAAAHDWIGRTFLSIREPAKSEEHFRAALAIREHLYGENDLSVAEDRAALGRALIELHRYDEAQTYLDRARAVQERKLKPDSRALAQTLDDIAVLRQHSGHPEEARKLFEQVIAIHRKDGDRAALARVLFNMAALLDDQGLLTDAEPYYKESRQVHLEISPNKAKDPDVAFVLTGYGWNLIRQQRPCEAAPLLEEAAAIRNTILQEDDWYRPWTHSLLGEALAHCPTAPRAAEAESLLVQSWETIRNNRAVLKEPKDFARQRVIDFYESRGNKPKADEYRAEQPNP